ncbi:hypothetical protein DENSPDRAFT_221362 [Dentipellis sp. KUC8613]|nr:hypothetical protein DENSPDRAFT_221362 [Dentipellis sp. KUC8613]
MRMSKWPPGTYSAPIGCTGHLVIVVSGPLDMAFAIECQESRRCSTLGYSGAFSQGSSCGFGSTCVSAGVAACQSW